MLFMLRGDTTKRDNFCQDPGKESRLLDKAKQTMRIDRLIAKLLTPEEDTIDFVIKARSTIFVVSLYGWNSSSWRCRCYLSAVLKPQRSFRAQ